MPRVLCLILRKLVRRLHLCFQASGKAISMVDLVFVRQFSKWGGHEAGQAAFRSSSFLCYPNV